jgi:hypothetical protein
MMNLWHSFSQNKVVGCGDVWEVEASVEEWTMCSRPLSSFHCVGWLVRDALRKPPPRLSIDRRVSAGREPMMASRS